MKRPSPIKIKNLCPCPAKKRKLAPKRNLPNELILAFLAFIPAGAQVLLKSKLTKTKEGWFKYFVDRNVDSFCANDIGNFLVNWEGSGFFFGKNNLEIISPDELTDLEEGGYIWFGANSPLPSNRSFGMYYFEVEIRQKSEWSTLELGFLNNSNHGATIDSSGMKRVFSRLNQSYSYCNSWAYDQEDVPLTIGCGYDFLKHQIFVLFKDRKIVLAELSIQNLYPSVIITRPDEFLLLPDLDKAGGDHIFVNYGKHPFAFDFPQ